MSNTPITNMETNLMSQMKASLPPREMGGSEGYFLAYNLCRSGKRLSFPEEASEPPTRGRSYIDSTYPEVAPEEILKVAAMLLASGGTAKDSIAKAYELITETQLFCLNVRHWNNKVRRGHASVEVDAAIQQCESLGRDELVMKLFDHIGIKKNQTDAGKLFNEWIKETVRYEEFTDHGPYNSILSGNPNNWNSRWTDYPVKTKPSSAAPRKKQKGEHETAPWWNTDDVWWPDPTDEELNKEKDSLFTQKSAENRKGRTLLFLCETVAKSALEKFASWVLGNQKAQPKSPSKQPRSKSTGKLLSRKPKGRAR